MTAEERRCWESMRRGLLMQVSAIDKLLESAQQHNDTPARESVPANNEPASGRLRAVGGPRDLRRI